LRPSPVAPVCFWLVVECHGVVLHPFKAAAFFFSLLFVNQSDARFRETTLPHTFRPGRVSSPKSPPASALTHS
jgi:hypothetical protein